MANTYTLISSNVLASSAASVTFSSIPSTYTDLVLRFSTRSDDAIVRSPFYVTVNGLTTTIYSYTQMTGIGAATASGRATSTTAWDYQGDGSTATASTFRSAEIYIPNYAGTTQKPVSGNFVAENNSATSNVVAAQAGLANLTSAITSISFVNQSTFNFVTGSSFYLYGIKNS